jgi:hypothetical protein
MPKPAEEKDRHNRGFIAGVFVGAFFLGLFTFFIAHAFNGPTSAPGVGSGAVGVGSTTNDISIGTSSPSATVKLLVVGSTTDTTAYALQLLQSNTGPLLYVRNDGALSIATTTVTAGTVTIQGNLTISGQINGGSDSTAIPASNITGGVFSSNETQSNFAFPESLGINTSSQVGLPQALSVYGNEYLSGNLYAANAYASSSSAFFGIGAGTAGLDNNSNTAIGYEALDSMTSASKNVAVGPGALQDMTSGLGNVAVGMGAGLGVVTGTQDVIIGNQALNSNDDYPGIVAVGSEALQSSTGPGNTAVGYGTLLSDAGGGQNTALGYEAGYDDVSGNGNIFIGYQAGYNVTTSNNLYINNATGTPLIYGNFNSNAVGINTTTIAQALTVQGNIYASGNITCGGTCGGGGGLSGGQTSFIPLWTSPSALGTSTLQATTNALVTTGGFAIGTTTDQAAGNLMVTGNVTTTNLTISKLGSTGTPCLAVNSSGVVATTTCGGGGLSGGTNNWIPLWTGASTLATSTLQQNGTTTYTLNGFAIGTSTLEGAGNLLITGNYLGGTLSANLVSSNAFGSGNFAFPSNLNIGTSSTLGASTLSVYGNELVTGTASDTFITAGGISVGTTTSSTGYGLYIAGSNAASGTQTFLQNTASTSYSEQDLFCDLATTTASNCFTGFWINNSAYSSTVTGYNMGAENDLDAGIEAGSAANGLDFETFNTTPALDTQRFFIGGNASGNLKLTIATSGINVAGSASITATATVENSLLSVGGSLFSTANFTNVTNSAASTSLIGTVNGTTTIPANVLKAGSQIHISAYGNWTTQSTQQNNSFWLSLGSNSVQSLAGASIVSISNKPWEITCDISVWSGGVSGVWDPSCFFIGTALGDTALPEQMAMVGVTSTLNTTITSTLNLSWLWAVASTTNSITSTEVSAYLIP